MKEYSYKRLNIRVRPEMHEWFSESARLRGLSLNAMTILALESYMQQQEMMPLLPLMAKLAEETKEKA